MPRFVKINPEADPETVDEKLTQPGEISMREVTEEFLAAPDGIEDEEEFPDEPGGLILPILTIRL